MNFDTSDVKSIISFGRMLKSQSMVRSVVSIVSFLINLPAPFKNDYQIDLHQVINEELSLHEGSSKDLLEQDSAKFKSYELLILSVLLPANPESVRTLISFDKTII